jgi:hypothetical protein
LAALREDSPEWWTKALTSDHDELEEIEEPAVDTEGLRRVLDKWVLPWF